MDTHRFWIGYITRAIGRHAFHVSDAPDDIIDDEIKLSSFLLVLIDSGPARNGPVKRTPGRLPRIPFTSYQLNELETAYSRTNYLSSEDANKLAARLDLTCIRVKIWFQNRRARERREKRETELKTSPPQLQIPATAQHHFKSMIPSSGS